MSGNPTAYGRLSRPLEQMLAVAKVGGGRPVGELVAIGPPPMMRAVSDLTKPWGARTIASLDSIMVDATEEPAGVLRRFPKSRISSCLSFRPCSVFRQQLTWFDYAPVAAP